MRTKTIVLSLCVSSTVLFLGSKLIENHIFKPTEIKGNELNNVVSPNYYSQQGYSSLAVSSSEADKRGIEIMEYSGTWGQTMEQVLPYMSSDGIEKAISIYLDKHLFIEHTTAEDIKTIEDTIKSAYPHMADEAVQRIKSRLYNFIGITPPTTTTPNNVPPNIAADLNEADKRGIEIMEYSGTWGQTMEQVLPYMSSDGIEKAISIYLDKHLFIEHTTAEDIKTIEDTIKSAYSYMTGEAVQRVKSRLLEVPISTSTSKTDNVNNLIIKSYEADKKGIDIMNKTGRWGQLIELLLPKMSSKGVEKVVSIYLDKNLLEKYTTSQDVKTIENTINSAYQYMTEEAIQRVKERLSKFGYIELIII